MSPIRYQRITIRTIVVYTLCVGLLSLLVLYVSFQARFIVAGPTLEVYTDNQIVSGRTVAIEGVAQNIVSISLNGRTIYTDENGYFKETVVLEDGYTLTTLRARDRYGREVTASRSFVPAETLTLNQ